MRIKFGTFTLNSDSQSYWITKEYEGKDAKGKPKIQEKRITGYQRKLDDLIEDLPERVLRESDAQDMKQAIKDLNALKREISKSFSGKLRQYSKSKVSNLSSEDKKSLCGALVSSDMERK